MLVSPPRPISFSVELRYRRSIISQWESSPTTLLNHAQQDPTEELHGEEHFLTPQMKKKTQWIIILQL